MSTSNSSLPSVDCRLLTIGAVNHSQHVSKIQTHICAVCHTNLRLTRAVLIHILPVLSTE